MSGYRFDRMKVLVVDDNVHMRKLVTTILQAFGVIQIYEAENGERAWAILREANPDVVVLDWMMEGMSGIDLTKMIRTNPQSPNPFVPVIMLTGHTLVEDVNKARDAGINEFIAKPVSVKTMMQRLTAVTLDPSSASILNVRAGAPALLIERVSRLEDQRVVEYTRSHYRGDAYDFVAELRIGDDP